MAKFPRIKPSPKVERVRELLKPCVNCGKGLGNCRGGWCTRCVTKHIDATTPNVEDLRSASELLGRKEIPGTRVRRFGEPNYGD